MAVIMFSRFSLCHLYWQLQIWPITTNLDR